MKFTAVSLGCIFFFPDEVYTRMIKNSPIAGGF